VKIDPDTLRKMLAKYYMAETLVDSFELGRLYQKKQTAKKEGAGASGTMQGIIKKVPGGGYLAVMEICKEKLCTRIYRTYYGCRHRATWMAGRLGYKINWIELPEGKK